MHNASIEKIRADIAELNRQAVARGEYGEDYERTEAQAPTVSEALARACLTQLPIAYEIMIEYIKACTSVSRALPLEMTAIDHYRRYADVALAYKGEDITGDTVTALEYVMALMYTKDIATGKAGYLTTLSKLVEILDDIDTRPPRAVELPEDFDVQVDAYLSQREEHYRKLNEIAARNKGAEEKPNVE